MQSKRERSGKKSLLGREERHLAALDTLGTAAVRAIELLAVLSNNFHCSSTHIATLSALGSAALGRVSCCSIRCRHLRCHCSCVSPSMPRNRHRWASSQAVQTYNPFCAVSRLFKLSIIVLQLQRDAIVDLEEEGELTGNTLVSLVSGEYKAGNLEMTACIIALATTTQPQCPSSAPPTRQHDAPHWPLGVTRALAIAQEWTCA